MQTSAALMLDDAAHLEVMCVDMNGILRGKWEPMQQLETVMAGNMRLPLSTLILDIWGRGNDEATGLGQSAGDPDGLCVADERTLVNMPWTHGMQVLTTMTDLAGTPSAWDPRAILARVLARYAAHGWTPVVACELEFYLLAEDSRHQLDFAPPENLWMGADRQRAQLYRLDSMSAMAPVLATIRAYARAQQVPAAALLAEIGPGQFEFNLDHRADAMAAADDAIYLKRIVAAAARKHGCISTFMAKPYTDLAGSGMHVHASIVDADGTNILDEERSNGHLQAAVAGLLTSMPAAQAIFAPHANSYRRFQPDSFAPVACNWGRDNRAAAIRVPAWTGANARIEARMAGADANPYLLLAVVLGSMLEGLEKHRDPPLAMEDPAYVESAVPTLSHDWLAAIDRFAAAPSMAAILGEHYRDLFATIKRHEAMSLQAMVTDVDRQTYLGRI